MIQPIEYIVLSIHPWIECLDIRLAVELHVLNHAGDKSRSAALMPCTEVAQQYSRLGQGSGFCFERLSYPLLLWR